MKSHTFMVYGEVRGQGRPRVSMNQRRLYKAPKDAKYESKIKDAYINSGGGWFGDSPLEMIIETHRALPTSRPKKIKSESDVFKPDASNVIKAIEDALNGIAYNDDRQIVHVECRKFPRVREDEYLVVTIREVES